MFVDELHFSYDHVELFGFFYVESTGIEAKGIILVFSFYYKLLSGVHYYGELCSSPRGIADRSGDSLRQSQMIDGDDSFLFLLVLTIIMAVLKYFNVFGIYSLSLKLLRY